MHLTGPSRCSEQAWGRHTLTWRNRKLLKAEGLYRAPDGFGEEGIRTPGSLSTSTVFKTAALNHSATSPHRLSLQVQSPAPVSEFTTRPQNYEVCRPCRGQFQRTALTRATRLLRRRRGRDDALDAHVGDEVAVVLVAVHDNHRQWFARAALALVRRRTNRDHPASRFRPSDSKTYRHRTRTPPSRPGLSRPSR